MFTAVATVLTGSLITSWVLLLFQSLSRFWSKDNEDGTFAILFETALIFFGALHVEVLAFGLLYWVFKGAYKTIQADAELAEYIRKNDEELA